MTQRSVIPETRCRRFPDAVFQSILLLSIAMFFAAAGLYAQVTNGINGTVTDATGAVIPGANVTVTNPATGVVSHGVTSSAGTFIVIGLNPGQYSVAVEATGFEKSVRTDVIVETARVSTVDFRMAPGATSSTVQVVASAVSLNTTSPVIGTELSNELVNSIPLEISGLARQIDSFETLTPGVGSNANSTNTIGGPTGININGSVSYESGVQFNGVPVAFVDFSGNQTGINPPYEMINEFRVNSSTFDARYGVGKGIVTYSMIAGTNKLHADAFEILRNQLFDSDGFFPTHFSPDGHPAPPIDQQNDYGFTVSGPVILPHVYSGKNRTFFLFSTDWFRQNEALNGIGTVPTPAMKTGDFTNFVDANDNLIPIYDPTTGQQFQCNGVLNMICQNRFSTLANAILPQIPKPDRPGLVYGLESNKLPAIPSVSITQHLWGYTLDENIGSSQSIHFSQWRDSLSSPYFTANPIVPSSNELQSEVNNTTLGSGFLLNYVKTVTPNLVATAGADWIGLISGQHNAFTASSFGGVTGGTTFPLINFDGQNAPDSWGANGAAFFGCCEGGLTVINTRRLGAVLVNNWLWTKGRNTIDFGGEFRRTLEDIISCNFCSGTFNFSQRTTSTPNSNDPNFGYYGSSFASFLLGEADAGERILANEQRLRNKAFATYFQDNIKINKRLTASAGLRWDVMVPFSDESNDVIYVNPAEPVSDPGAAGLPGGASILGNCMGCSGITRAAIHWRHFQPRLGFSYALNSKTVLQSGFYITVLDGGAYEYGTSTVAAFYTALLDGEFVRDSTASSAPGYGNWDTNPMPLPQPTSFSPSIANGGVVFTLNPQQGGAAPFDEQWNASIQREIPWNMFLRVAYVGSRTLHLPTTNELPNQPNPSVLSYGSLLGESVTSPDAVAAGIADPYPDFVEQFGGSATVEQALAPYPMYSGLYPVYELDGTSFYNSFQAQAEKRFSNGLSYMANVTISRNTANCVTGSPQYAFNGENAYNPRPEYSPSYLDQLYVTNFVYSYQLPVGPGQRYLNSKGLLGQVLGGWQLSGILTYQGGHPMGAYNGFNPLLVNFFDRPDIVPGVALKTFSYSLSRDYFTGKTSTPPIQFTTNAFANTGPWQIGDSKRNYAALRTPPLRLESFDVIKSFHITEGLRASLRVDYFNAFNRTQFPQPDDNSLDSTFGQITYLASTISNRVGQATFRVEF
ncbi:MAG: carboxypeptidase-like regulatory domain-containing protein [Terracidiphilus sp.]